MDIKKNQVISNIITAKDTAKEELRVIKHGMITGIEDVSNRLTEFNTDMVSIVSQNSEIKKNELKYNYLEANNKVEMKIDEKIRDQELSRYADGKINEIKSHLLTGNKVALDSDLDIDIIDSKYVGGRYDDVINEDGILKTEKDSTFNNQLYESPEYIGFLKDQTNLVQGKLYRGVYGDRLTLLYCKNTIAWVKGTELASPDLVPYTAKSIKEGLL